MSTLLESTFAEMRRACHVDALDKSNGVKLFRDVLRHPNDKLPKLIYADWLEANDGDVDKIALIRGERRQCVMDWRQISDLFGHKHADFDRFSLGHEGWVHYLYTKIVHLEPTTMTYVLCPVRLYFKDGFLTKLNLDCELFFQMAHLLFAEFPLTEIILNDVHATNIRSYAYTDSQLHGSPQWRYLTMPPVLDEALFGRRPHARSMAFPTQSDAQRGLSDLCVDYGRCLVGFPVLDGR